MNGIYPSETCILMWSLNCSIWSNLAGQTEQTYVVPSENSGPTLFGGPGRGTRTGPEVGAALGGGASDGAGAKAETKIGAGTKAGVGAKTGAGAKTGVGGKTGAGAMVGAEGNP